MESTASASLEADVLHAHQQIKRVLFHDGREAIKQNRVFANNLAEL
jgi:hypothetical protein